MAKAGKKDPVTHRVGRYGFNRIQPKVVREASNASLRGGTQAAMEAMRPESVTAGEARAAIEGRYADGGKARFAEMVTRHGLDEDALIILEDMHVSNVKICAITGTGFLFGAISMTLWGDGLLSFGAVLICMIFTFGCAIRALHADFSAWQIRTRAFGGLRAYLSRRLAR